MHKKYFIYSKSHDFNHMVLSHAFSAGLLLVVSYKYL